MSNESLKYVPDAALKLLPAGRIGALKDKLLSAAEETLKDVDLWQSGGPIPAAKQPLDAGFIQWPEELLADLRVPESHRLTVRL